MTNNVVSCYSIKDELSMTIGERYSLEKQRHRMTAREWNCKYREWYTDPRAV